MSENENNKDNQEKIKMESQEGSSGIKQTEDLDSPKGYSLDFPEIRCPLCPKFAKITINNIKNEIISECPDNHYMKLDYLSFIEKSTDHPLVCTKCSICNNTGKTNNYCLECNKYFCIECMEKHNKNELPLNNGGMHSNILLRNNSLENNNSNESTPGNILNTSFPQHLSTLNLAHNNSSSINPEQHHIININNQDNYCAIHSGEKFFSFCLKCNKSFCQKCLEEIKKGLTSNLNVYSCGKLGNLKHSTKKMKDIVGAEKLKKIKQHLDKEVEMINYIENQSNIIIEQLLEKINNLREIHLFKQQLYNLYLVNQENASLVKTINELGTSFKLQVGQFNTSEKLLNNLEIIQIPEKEDIKNNDNLKKEDKKEEVAVSKVDKKNEIKKMKEEKKKEIQKIKEEKKKEIRQRKEELKKLKAQKKKEQKDKKNGKEEIKEGEEEIPSSQNNDTQNNQDMNNENHNV